MSKLLQRKAFKLDADHHNAEHTIIQGDTRSVLMKAAELILLQFRHITMYDFNFKEENDIEVSRQLDLHPYLITNKEKDSTIKELPFSMDMPTEVCAFIEKWLINSAVYPEQIHRGDGSYVNGFRISIAWNKVKIVPVYIYYGK
jgi:hypothetical protein